MYREIEMRSDMYKPFLPFAHFISAPAFYGVLINGKRLVGNHKLLADSEHFAESFANRTCAVGIVEIEHQIAWLAKFHAVGYETFGECVFMSSVCSPYLDYAFIMTFVVGGFHRIRET